MTNSGQYQRRLRKAGSILLGMIGGAFFVLPGTALAMYEYCAAFDPPEVDTDTAMVMYHECTEPFVNPLSSESERAEAARIRNDICEEYALEYMRCCQLTNGRWYCPIAKGAGIVSEDKEDATDLMTIFLALLP